MVFNLSSGYTVSGTVRNNSGVGISRIWVEIWSHSKHFYGWAETDNAGVYSIGGLPAASDYVIVVEARAASTQRYVPYLETDITISGDTTKYVTMLSPVCISGHVYEGDGETGVSGVVVIAYSASKNFWDHTTTDSTGAYEFTDTPNAWDYEMTVIPANYAEQTKTGQFAGSTIDFILETGGSITGTVKNTSGVGIEGAWVEASSPSVLTALGGTITHSNGQFQITGLRANDLQEAPLDDYVVTAYAEGYPVQSQGGKSVGDVLTFTLTRGDSNKIAGTVQDAVGDPVSSEADDEIALIQVQVFENVADGGFVKSQEANSDGTFEVTGLDANTEYQLRFKIYRTDYAAEYAEWCGTAYQGTASRDGAIVVTTSGSPLSVDFQFTRTWAELWQ